MIIKKDEKLPLVHIDEASTTCKKQCKKMINRKTDLQKYTNANNQLIYQVYQTFRVSNLLFL